MQHSNIIMVRFGELSTKGKNIREFIKKLGQNIKDGLKSFPNLTYDIKHDHIYIYLNNEDFEQVKFRLSLIPGLLSFSLCESVNKDIDSIVNKCLELAKEVEGNKTFKVVAKRIDKLFPFTSDEINRKVAGNLLHNYPNLKVDVHNPDFKIHITVREDIVYIYSKSYPGLGGYPTGIAGKALMLLSGGIDSPVASFLMMKRGVRLEMIHFAAPPYTSEQVIVKIKDIIKKLNVFQPSIKLYIVPFTEIQKKIYEVCDRSYAITIMRRMMLQIASRVAINHKDIVLCNGESIGQVASQTLQSIRAIEKDCILPIIRPLATYDKLDIIKLSKFIGTYDISIRPYEDCCTIFSVKNPTTCPHFDKVNYYESKFDFSNLLDEAYKNIKVEMISEEENYF